MNSPTGCWKQERTNEQKWSGHCRQQQKITEAKTVCHLGLRAVVGKCYITLNIGNKRQKCARLTFHPVMQHWIPLAFRPFHGKPREIRIIMVSSVKISRTRHTKNCTYRPPCSEIRSQPWQSGRIVHCSSNLNPLLPNLLHGIHRLHYKRTVISGMGLCRAVNS